MKTIVHDVFRHTGKEANEAILQNEKERSRQKGTEKRKGKS